MGVKALIGVVAMLAVALVFGGAIGRSAESPSVLAMVSLDSEWTLARLDPASLETLPGESLTIGRPMTGLGRSAYTWAFSPDASDLAVGGRLLGGVRLVDLTRLRVSGTMSRAFEPLAWLTPRRLLASEQSDLDTAPDTLLTVDPVARRIVARKALGATILRTDRTKDRLVLLLGPRGRIAFVRLAVADALGTVRQITLRRIRAGSAVNPRTHSGRFQIPGLAADAVTGRAFVVGTRLVAEVDVRTMAVRYHALGKSLRPLKGSSSGSSRSARWLGEGLVAVGGYDETGGDRPLTKPAGLRVVDTLTWTTRVIDKRASWFAWADGSLLAFGTGTGLSVYAPDGRLRFHLLGDEQIWVQAVGGYAYAARVQERGGVIIDLRSGAIRPVPRSIPVLLVPGQQPY